MRVSIIKKTMVKFSIIFLFILGGCSQGVSQDEYDNLQKNYQLLREKLDNVLVSGTCGGYLVATVRGFSQDYVSDEADKMVIVTEFQSKPFMLPLSDEQLKTLEMGKNYVFSIENKDITLISNEFAKQTNNVQQLILQYQLKISSVSSATETQSGLDGSTLSCTPKQ
jgi:hypothetical protein